MSVENKVAIITGGASGIGFHYALELLRNGLRAVTLADTDATKGAEAVAKISDNFGADKVLFVKTDVTVKDQIENAFKQTVEKFGNLDIVINNAGVMVEAIWEKMININLNGTIYGCILAMEEYFPKYKSGDEGIIVNISSIAGIQPITILPFYCATKHAIIGLSRSLGTQRNYETTKTRIVTICPGGTDTPLMQDLENKAFNERYRTITGVFLKMGGDAIKPQTIDIVPKCMMKAIQEGSNGSIWVVENGEIYEIAVPDRKDIKK